MFTCAARPRTADGRAGAEDVDDVVAVGAVDDDDVGRAVAGGAADRAGQVDVDLDQVRAGQVVDGGRVGAAERVEVDRLDVVEVHHDVAEVAREAARGRRWRRPSKISAPALPLKSMRVVAGLAFDDVAAVAGVPLEDVVAGAEEGGVVALLAVDEVVAVAAEQQVDAVAAEQRVVARAAVDGDLDQRGEVAGGGERVVAAVGVEHEVLAGADVDGERRGVEAVEADARAVGGGGELLRRRCRR